MKRQQWMFKVFSMISSSSSSSISIFNNVRPRSFCSATTKRNTSCCLSVAQPPLPVSDNNKPQQQQLNILFEKKHPLLIVPYDHVTPKKYLLRRPYRRLRGDHGSYVCDGTLGFINLFHDDDDDDDDDELIINKKKKVYDVYLPEIDKRRICGSSEGWLVTVHENGEFQLLNPVTRSIVHLPPFTAFPGVHPLLSDYELRLHSFIYKVVTNTTTTDSTTLPAATATATATSTVVVMAIYEYYGGLAFCRTALSSSSSTGNGTTDIEQAAKTTSSWIKIPNKTPMSAGRLGEFSDVTYEVIDGVSYWVTMSSTLVDVTFYKGNFYAVGRFGHVCVVKGLDGPSPFAQFLIGEPETEPEYCSHMNYLVESYSSSGGGGGGGGGDLLMVMRNIEEEETKVETETEEEIFERRPYRTNGFRVLKLDLNGPSWEEVTNLGEDCALFVGHNHSFSFSASKISAGCRGNCIYFTDNHEDRIFYYPNGGHDIGVYNLEDASFEKLNYETCSSQLFMPPPVWYVPN